MKLTKETVRMAALLSHEQLAELVVNLYAKVLLLEAQTTHWPMTGDGIDKRIRSELETLHSLHGR